MNQFVSNLSEKINEEFQDIDLNRKDMLQQAATAVKILESSLSQLKTFILNYTFKEEAEEIYFFKEAKPRLFSKLIYYQKVHSIIMRRPAGSNTVKKNYLHGKLERISDFFNRNLEFYEYYRSGNTYLDKYYFLRGKPDIWLNFDSFCFELDQRFSSCFDFKVAKIIANDMLTVFLNNELTKLDRQPEEQIIHSKHTWTGSKTDLVEKIYGIHERGSVDNGNIDIKELADFYGNIFNIDLKDIYRIYLNIRNRKGSRTSYLDSMRDNLNKKMDEDDSR